MQEPARAVLALVSGGTGTAFFFVDYWIVRNAPSEHQTPFRCETNNNSRACATIRDSIGRSSSPCRSFHISCVQNAQKGCNIIQQNQTCPENAYEPVSLGLVREHHLCTDSSLIPAKVKENNLEASAVDLKR